MWYWYWLGCCSLVFCFVAVGRWLVCLVLGVGCGRMCCFGVDFCCSVGLLFL